MKLLTPTQSPYQAGKAPIAYTPDANEKGQTVYLWDDAVTMVLTYAEIPYQKLYDEQYYEKSSKYDWLHLHHEDSMGQYGKFYANHHICRLGTVKSNQRRSTSQAFRLRESVPDEISCCQKNQGICWRWWFYVCDVFSHRHL